MSKKESDKDLLATFKSWFKLVADVEAKQRQRENDDLRFQVGEFQWDPKAYKERMGDSDLGTSGRPTLSISLTKQPMQLVKNQIDNADLGVEVHPVSEKAEKETAEAAEGLYMRIQRDSNAGQARGWASDRAIQCGRGWYQIVTQYDENGDHELDQEIVIKRILDGSCVGMDPSAQEPDFSDAEWGYLDEWMDYDTFEDMYPDAEAAGLDSRGLSELANEEPDWVVGVADKRAVRVPQVWRKKHTRTHVSVLRDGSIVPTKELGKRKSYGEKQRDEVVLCWYRITAKDILEQEEYTETPRANALKLIPLIPVIGNELQMFDGERRYEGMVRPARDGQRAFNYSISAAVEDVGRLSKIPYIGAAGAFKGYEEKWNAINVRNIAFVEFNDKDDQGQPITEPKPMQVDGTKLGLSLQLSEMSKGLVQSATAVYDPSLGNTQGPHESGRKVLALQQQADAGTSNFLKSLSKVSIPYESRVVMERIPYYYDRPGRITRVLGEEDKVSMVMLNAPYTMGQDGRPQRVVGKNQQNAKVIDFRKGKYSTAVTVGKSYQTRMQQGQEVWAQLMPNLPPEAQVILLPTVMRFMDTPGASDAADLMAKFRDAKFPGLVGDEGQGPTPEQLQAQVQGQQQKMQEMGQQLQAMGQQLQTDMAKQQASIHIAQMEIQAKLQMNQENNAAKIEAARVAAAGEALNQKAAAQEELLATGLKIQAESDANAVAQMHETRLAHQDKAHEFAMASAASKTLTRHTEKGSEQGQEHSKDSGATSSPPEPQADGAGE